MTGKGEVPEQEPVIELLDGEKRSTGRRGRIAST